MQGLELWVEYIIRFSHLVAGIMWVGSSFYFIWLDGAFVPPEVPKRNVDGELYMVHGGFYYQVEKRKIFPGELPKVLHWFKWEATFTWITGFMLLIVVYYLKGANLLVDKQVLNMTQSQAVSLSLALAVSAWFIYDFIWHRIANKTVCVVSSLALLVLIIYINTHAFSGRGAFIQTGFMMGSMMLLNVWVRILPGQQKMVSDAQAGKVPDYSFSAKAKTRSVHNTYFIFPVLFIMLSNHYATVYSHPYNWVLLIMLSVSGAMVRHAMVTKDPKQRWTLLPAAIGLAGIVYMTDASYKINVSQNSEPVAFEQVAPIFHARCISCHSVNPTDDVIKLTPKGIVLEQEKDIRIYLPRIYEMVNVAKSMPLGNKTQMTDEERNLIGAWVQQEMKNQNYPN
ncbi:MAG: urate hydroxylase PuuD [Pseudobdellovibrio sp.]